MKIIGHTVGTTMPRANYAQTDPNKADYIKNKPDAAIQNAQTTANNAVTAAGNAQDTANNAVTAAGNAQDTANNALPKAGGAMTGPIAMGENKVTDLAAPELDGDATNKKYVDDSLKAKRKVFNTTLTINDWEGDAAPYTQSIGIEGILATDIPHYGIVYSDNAETALLEKEAFSLVDDLDTADGSVTFTCFDEKPEVSLTIQLEVNR